jgi:hypothetical protein
MRAPEVWQAMVEAMEADARITAIVGDAIYLTDGEREFEVPSITGTLIASTQGERFTQSEWQLDCFGKTMQDAVDLGERIVRLFDRDVRAWIGGLRVWSRVTDEREFHGPVADKVYRRSLDIELEVIRSRYVREVAS